MKYVFIAVFGAVGFFGFFSFVIMTINESNRQLEEQRRVVCEQENVFRSRYMGVPFRLNGVMYTAVVAPVYGRTFTCVGATGDSVELERDILIRLVDARN